MAPKRARSNSNHDDALVYFIGMATQWTPTNARLGSFHELILDAHQWGEMRVRAEMYAMQLRDVPARTRLNILTTSSENWYVAGYRMYLLPESSDSLDALRYRPRTNEALMTQTEWSRRALASQAGVAWRAKHATTIFDEALAAVEADKPPAAAPMATASPVTASATTSRARAPLVRPAPPPPAGGAALPHTLARFLADPAEQVASNPRAGIENAVAEAFREQRVCRAWEGSTLRFLEQPAYTLQSKLHARGLDTVYGCGNEELGKDVMRRAGLQRLAAGGYNAVWVVGDRGAPWLRDLFGHDVGDAFLAKKLVLRVPRPHAEWLTFTQAVGEASNMLFTAQCGVGPRVAMLSYASKTFPDDEADEEGVRVPKYKIFALLERATESVDSRYDPNALQVASSATASGPYVQALVVCIYQFSQEGFVHLDGTLRNFVDCYARELPLQLTDFLVRVIDVDQKSFRRLCPNASTDWRDLFLINLLIVFTFLKLRLGHRWDRQRHWSPVAQGVAQLLREVPGRTTLPSIAFWEGSFVADEQFPDMSGHKYAACSHSASARFMLRQMRYYLLEQPLEICEAQYLNVRRAHQPSPKELTIAQDWYDNVYRNDMYPAHCYFRDALQPRSNGKPRLFAAVLYEYLSTPHSELKAKFAHTLHLSNDHACFGGVISRNEILGF